MLSGERALAGRTVPPPSFVPVSKPQHGSASPTAPSLACGTRRVPSADTHSHGQSSGAVLPQREKLFCCCCCLFFFCYFFVFFFFPPVATATTSHLLSGQLGLAGQPESPSGPWAGCGPGQRKARAGSPSPPLGPAAAVPGLDGVRVPRLRRCPSGGCISPSCCRWCEVPPKQPIQPSCVFTRGYW